MANRVLISPGDKLGKVLQVVQGSRTAAVNVSSVTYTDISLSATITPSLATSKIFVIVDVAWGGQIGENIYRIFSLRLLRDAVEIKERRNEIQGGVSGTGYIASGLNGTMTILDSPATTSATTYKIQTKINTVGASTSSLTSGGQGISHITLIEVAV